MTDPKKKSNPVLMSFLMLVGIASGICGCSPKSSSGSLGEGSGQDGGGGTVDEGCGQSANLVQENDGGTITFRLAGNTDPCSVDGYVVGSAGTTSTKKNDDGSFVISGVDEGEQDIIVTGNSSANTTSGKAVDPTDIGGSNLQAEKVATGIRYNKIAAGAPPVTLRLGKLGTIIGKVTLSGAVNHVGIDVYIPGTSYIAKTDEGGNYRIDLVPPGVHDLRFEFPGYGAASSYGLEVVPAGTLNAPDMILFTGAGEGRILILDESGLPVESVQPQLSSRLVRFAVQVSGSPRLMKISEDGNFANVDWQPFRSTGSYTFRNFGDASGGRVTKRLSVKTLDGNTEGELEATVVIELFSEIRGKEILTVDNLDVNGETALLIRIKSIMAKNAVEMRYSTKSDFLGSAWVPAEETKTLSVDAEGEYAVFVQFRNQDLVVSDVYSRLVDVRLFPSGSVSFSLPLAQKTAGDATLYQLQNVVSPRRTGDVQILVSHTNEITDAVEFPYAASVDYDVGSYQPLCGLDKIRVWMRYNTQVKGRPLTLVSEPKDVPASYKCSIALTNFPGERTDNINLGAGGGKVFFWAGQIAGTYNPSVTGYLFDASTKTYSLINPGNQPEPRMRAKVFYVNNKFLVFGGRNGSSDYYDGGIYDPATDSWSPISEPPIQTPDSWCDDLDEQLSSDYFTHVIGDYVLIWGNRNYGEYNCDPNPRVGYRYQISTNTWSNMNSAGFPQAACNLERDWDFTPTVAGDKLFVWSGLDCYGKDTLLSGGGLYDPVTNSWTTIATLNAPTDRFDYITAWTGSELMVWGGRAGSGDTPTYTGMETGAFYNPATNTWRAMSAAPYFLNYTGNFYYYQSNGVHVGYDAGVIAIFGGYKKLSRNWGGLRYNVAANTWAEMPILNGPHFSGLVKENVDDTRVNPVSSYMDRSASTDGKLLIWTRMATPVESNSTVIRGSAYDISENKWSPLATSDRALSGLETSIFLRNYPQIMPFENGKILIYGGGMPYENVSSREYPLRDGAIMILP